MSDAIEAMREMVDKHLAMGLKARMEAQINIIEGELRERDERISELEAAHGMLTAEQVMVIVGKHQPDYCSDTHVCFDWQTIADELNAILIGKGDE